MFSNHSNNSFSLLFVRWIFMCIIFKVNIMWKGWHLGLLFLAVRKLIEKLFLTKFSSINKKFLYSFNSFYLICQSIILCSFSLYIWQVFHSVWCGFSSIFLASELFSTILVLSGNLLSWRVSGNMIFFLLLYL